VPIFLYITFRKASGPAAGLNFEISDFPNFIISEFLISKCLIFVIDHDPYVEPYFVYDPYVESYFVYDPYVEYNYPSATLPRSGSL